MSAYCNQKPTAQGPPGKPGPYMGWMFLNRRFSPQPALRATECAPVGSARSIPRSGGKSARHVIRTDSHVRTCVEVLLMYARFTEGTIDPKKREDAEMIAESIFTAARQQKGFRGLSFCLDPRGEAVFLSLWESKEALLANEAMKKSESRYLKDALSKLKEISTGEASPKLYEVVEHEIPAVAAVR